METTGRNPLAVLGLPEGASYDVARRSFRRLASQTHPDHGGDHRAFLAVHAAWSELRLTLRAQPERRPNPYLTLITPGPQRVDRLEHRRVASAAADGAAGGGTFASLLERELQRLRPAA
jgi:hypothetical protein